jgi:serine/threonine protein kinase
MLDSLGHACLTDFGLCAKLDVMSSIKIIFVGNGKWVYARRVRDTWIYGFKFPISLFLEAPEVIHMEPYAFSCDFFSFGVLMYEMLHLSVFIAIYILI